jgi:hypothetical protein
MSSSDSRMHILQMIEDGKISAEEGTRLLNAITGNNDPAATAAPAGETTAETGPTPFTATAEAALAAHTAGGAQSSAQQSDKATGPDDPQIKYWKNWWMVPMAVGLTVTIVGGLLMYWAVQSTGVGFWFVCSWLPLLIGVAIMAFAWASSKSRWVHIRVEQAAGKRPRRIAISLPVPLKIVAWGLRTFGQNIPALKHTAVDEMLLALEDTATPDAPIFVDVTDGEKGERVQVYFG